jgi:hypothetical protein
MTAPHSEGYFYAKRITALLAGYFSTSVFEIGIGYERNGKLDIMWINESWDRLHNEVRDLVVSPKHNNQLLISNA